MQSFHHREYQKLVVPVVPNFPMYVFSFGMIFETDMVTAAEERIYPNLRSQSSLWLSL
jgi:hypothetical protein